jgi:hypothetical protein
MGADSRRGGGSTILMVSSRGVRKTGPASILQSSLCLR